jgi:cytochrome c oxidase cbb3-type subunit III
MTAMPRILLLICACWLASTAWADVDGARVYQNYCTPCHGLRGDGRGINAPHMSVVPRDHTNTAEMRSRSDGDLYQVIAEGGTSMNQSILMPAWGRVLADEEIHGLVRYLRAL